MWFKTDTTVVHLIRICILVLVDNAHRTFLSYCTNMLTSEYNNNMLNVTMTVQIRICGSKLILQSFTHSYVKTSIGG